MKQIMFVFLLCILAVSCGLSEDSSVATSQTITVSGSLGIASKKLAINSVDSVDAISAVDLTTLEMYCVAFNAAATSASSTFGIGGAFSVAGLPANTPFGCFVVNKTSKNIVATIKILDTGTGMSDQSSSSMSLGSSVSMGTITLVEGSSVIEVPKATIAAAQSTAAATLSVNDIHGTSWDLSCVGTDAACADFVADSPEVFFRILKATKSSQAIYGIGIWSSLSMFTTCGSIDMDTDGGTDIVSREGGDFTWVQNTQGAFTNATTTNSACPLRESGTADVDNIENYYAMDKLVVQGNMFTMNQEDEDSTTNCYFYFKTSVTFSPSSATVMYGSFETAEVVREDVASACAGHDIMDKKNSFVVKFTKK